MRALALALPALLAGCTVYTSCREEVLAAHTVEEPGALRASATRSERIGSAVGALALELQPEPALVVPTSSTRVHTFEASLFTREVEQVKHARVDLIIWDTDNHLTVYLMPPMALLYWWHAFSSAGDALSGELAPGTHLLGDDRLVVTTTQTTRVLDPVPAGRSRPVTRTSIGPEGDVDVVVRFDGAPGELRARTDEAGRARFAVTDLATIAPRQVLDDGRGALLVACPPGAPTRHELPPDLVPLLRLSGPGWSEPPEGPPSPAIAPLVAAGASAEEEGDLAQAVRCYGAALARAPADAVRVGLTRTVPRLLRLLGGPPPVPPGAAAAVDEGFAAIERAPPEARAAATRAAEAIEAAPWWSGGHRLAAAAHALEGRRGEAVAALALALALVAEGSDEARELREVLLRWRHDGGRP